MRHKIIYVEKKFSKWKKIYLQLKEEIEKGKYKNGSVFLTINRLCETFDVSTITARKVLDELEKDGLILKKQKIGAIINRKERRKIYLLFLPSVYTDGIHHSEKERFSWVIMRLMEGIIRNAEKNNLELKYLHKESVLNSKNEGIVIIEYSNLGPEFFSQLEGREKDIIVIHSPKPVYNFHTIRENLFKGAYLATRHLVESGCKKIGIIAGPLNKQWYLTRFQGYLEGLREFDIGFDKNLVKETTGEDYKEDERAIAELLKEGIDGVFCVNDIRAIHVLKYCEKKKIKVPEELCVCGFDDIEESRNFDLTTVNSHLEKIGKKAVDLAVKMMEGQVEERIDIEIEPELIIRKTTKGGGK